MPDGAALIGPTNLVRFEGSVLNADGAVLIGPTNLVRFDGLMLNA